MTRDPHAETSGVSCICPGSPMVSYPGACTDDATQEDFLCDHCRAMDCPTATSQAISDERWIAIYGQPEPAF